MAYLASFFSLTKFKTNVQSLIPMCKHTSSTIICPLASISIPCGYDKTIYNQNVLKAAVFGVFISRLTRLREMKIVNIGPIPSLAMKDMIITQSHQIFFWWNLNLESWNPMTNLVANTHVPRNPMKREDVRIYFNITIRFVMVIGLSVVRFGL